MTDLKQICVDLVMHLGWFRELEAQLQMVADSLICQHQEIEQELQNRIPIFNLVKRKRMNVSAMDLL